MDYAYKDLRRVSFHNADLHDARFAGSDLRGADFSGANLRGADLTHTTTGITSGNTVLIFLAALVVSGCSGFVAMLAGQTVQAMLASHNPHIRVAGIITLITTLLFIIYAWRRGLGNAIKFLMIPTVAVALLIGLVAYSSGFGTGMGTVYLIAAFILVVIMFVIGAIARTAAQSLSVILFIVVAVAGSLFSKTVGGGIGATIMAISCGLISKRAMSGADGFGSLRKVALFVTSRFGTSFHNADLANANFSDSEIRNADFSHADVSSVKWGASKRTNCID